MGHFEMQRFGLKIDASSRLRWSLPPARRDASTPVMGGKRHKRHVCVDSTHVFYSSTRRQPATSLFEAALRSGRGRGCSRRTMSKISSEKLIQAVKERRCIWDMRHVDYGDRQKRKTAWEAIADLFLTINATNEERKQVGTSAQLKWKHLRDRYAKDAKLRNVPTPTGARQKAPYLYKQQMSFLEDVIDTSLNGNEDENGFGKPNSHPAYRKKRKADPTEAKRIAAQKNAEDIQDDDRHFLLSLVPWMKHIPPQFKFAARMEMLQLANRYAMVPSLNAITASRTTTLPASHLSLLYPLPTVSSRSSDDLKYMGSDEGSDGSLY